MQEDCRYLDLDQLLQFLAQVQPSGGGTDIPEAVQAGLELAVANSQFRPKARKVILLFGDAPPRPEQLAGSLSIAKHFRGRYRGKLSTVTCRMPQPLPAMAAIAKAGGGEAHVLYDHERILDELLVLVFGGRFRADVYRFFELDRSRTTLSSVSGEAPPSGVGRATGPASRSTEAVSQP